MRQRLREIASESAMVTEVQTEQINLQNRADEQRNIKTAVFPIQPENILPAQNIQPTSFQPANIQPVQESAQTIAFQPVQESPQTVAFVPPQSTPPATQIAVEPPKNFVMQNPQNSQPVFTEQKKSRRGVFLPILVALIILLGAGGVGAYFIAQKFLVKSDTTANKNSNSNTTPNKDGNMDANVEKKSELSGAIDADSKDANANSNSNANTTETVKADTEKKTVESKTVQQKQVQKPTVQKQVQPVKKGKNPTKPNNGGGGGIFQ
jgi:hypothetical protein